MGITFIEACGFIAGLTRIIQGVTAALSSNGYTREQIQKGVDAALANSALAVQAAEAKERAIIAGKK